MMLNLSCPEEKREAILNYLRSNLDAGPKYYKAKSIANDLDLSPKEVGANLRKLSEENVRGLIIEPHAVTRSTTWKVALKDSASVSS